MRCPVCELNPQWSLHNSYQNINRTTFLRFKLPCHRVFRGSDMWVVHLYERIRQHDIEYRSAIFLVNFSRITDTLSWKNLKWCSRAAVKIWFDSVLIWTSDQPFREMLSLLWHAKIICRFGDFPGLGVACDFACTWDGSIQIYPRWENKFPRWRQKSDYLWIKINCGAILGS